MKKTYFLMLAVILFTVVFSSCGATTHLSPPAIPTSFSSGINVQYKDKELVATLSKTADGIVDIAVTKPDVLKDITLHFEGDECTFSYKSLSFDVNFEKLSETTACKKLVSYLKTVAQGGELDVKKDGSSWTYTFTDADGATVSVVQNADSGFFESISAPKYELYVTFTDFVAI